MKLVNISRLGSILSTVLGSAIASLVSIIEGCLVAPQLEETIKEVLFERNRPLVIATHFQGRVLRYLNELVSFFSASVIECAVCTVY